MKPAVLSTARLTKCAAVAPTQPGIDARRPNTPPVAPLNIWVPTIQILAYQITEDSSVRFPSAHLEPAITRQVG